MILSEAKLSESSCTCKRCVLMCKTQPCLPTPDEARDLEAKYPDRMVRLEMHYRVPPLKMWRKVEVCSPKIVGQDTRNERDQGRCVFLDGEDRCELHNRGEKPLEGRLANHDQPTGAAMFTVLSEWI